MYTCMCMIGENNGTGHKTNEGRGDWMNEARRKMQRKALTGNNDIVSKLRCQDGKEACVRNRERRRG